MVCPEALKFCFTFEVMKRGLSSYRLLILLLVDKDTVERRWGLKLASFHKLFYIPCFYHIPKVLLPFLKLKLQTRDRDILSFRVLTSILVSPSKLRCLVVLVDSVSFGISRGFF